MNHKAGFVNIIGSPNVGKSTLMNALVGERLSIITPKAQTTRHRILGMLHGEDFQIVFSDTPGVIQAAYPLQKAMMMFVKTSIQDADVLLYMTETRQSDPKDTQLFEKLQKTNTPLIVLINKIDKTIQKALEESVNQCNERFPKASILPISALKKLNIDLLLEIITKLLPEHPPYYSKDTLTDKPERFFVNEIVREKILLLYEREIPYSAEVVTEQFKERDDFIYISCLIFVERNSQKGILIGHRGQALKKLGIQSRESLEKFFNKKIFLKFHVKTNKNWHSDSHQLKKLGYLP
ncbi:MAG: GTPase Era [Flavobacteriales bacterium AspAUS03]